MAPHAEHKPSVWRWSAVLFVAAFAFLLASHPARNSNLWGHLAAGRDLARSGAPADALAGLPVHRAWAYNLALYGTHLAAGDFGLVFVKALLFAGLALLLFDLSRAGGGWWVPVTCTALALLACGTRLLLQPVTVSYLFLGLSLWLLRPRKQGDRPILPPPWPLLAVMVAWANADAWFVVGLATIALVWLGQALDSTAGAAGGQGGGEGRRGLSPFLQLLLSVGLLAAVCLLNPSHVRAFAFPPELSWVRGAGGGAAPGRVNSPFQADYFTSVGLSPAGLAFFPLLGLGLLSFGLNRRGWRWRRFLPWLGLAALSCFEARAVPFFAIMGGPALAWNLREALGHPSGGERRPSPRRRERVVWYGLGVALAVALLIGAWPGWLQGPPFEPRRWAIELPPSPARGAEAARRWHQGGELPPGSRVLHLSADTAYAFAWGCPEVPGVVDGRLAASLRGEPDASADWPDRMRAAGIAYVVVYDRDRGHLAAALSRLSADPEQWPLLWLEGDLAVFAWRDPAGTAAAAPSPAPLDLDRLAFSPPREKRAPDAAAENAGRRWWEALWKPAPRPSIDRDEATLSALLAETLRRQAPERKVLIWEASQVAGLAAAAGSGSPADTLAGVRLRLALVRPPLPEGEGRADRLPPLDRLGQVLRQRTWQGLDDTSAALLYQTVRAARRALAADPDDAHMHLLLGETYVRLLHATRERTWAARMPELAQLRLSQASAALNRAVALRPDLAQAHFNLGRLYRDLGYQDLALDHLRTYLKLSKKAGPPPGSDPALFREDVEEFEKELSDLAGKVEDALQAHRDESAGKRVLLRATIAKEKGLGGLARDILLESDISAFGDDGLVLELELLLGTGRAGDVRDWTAPHQRAALGASYHWLRAQSTAALGEYATAQRECDLLVASLGPGGGMRTAQVREGIVVLVARSLLDETPGWPGPTQLLRRASSRADFQTRLAVFARVLRQQADATVLRGLLALEQGEVEEAEAAFRQSLVLYQGGTDFNGRPVAQGYRALLGAAGR